MNFNTLTTLCSFATPQNVLSLLLLCKTNWLNKQLVLQALLPVHFKGHTTHYFELLKRITQLYQMMAKRVESLAAVDPSVKLIRRRGSYWQFRYEMRDFPLVLQAQYFALVSFFKCNETPFLFNLSYYYMDYQMIPIEPAYSGQQQLIKLGKLNVFAAFIINRSIICLDLENLFGGDQHCCFIIKRVSSQFYQLQRIFYSIRDIFERPWQVYDNKLWATNSVACQSDATTGGIRVRASPVYCPFDNRNTVEQGLFVYEIRISDAGTTKKWKLKSRRWQIGAEVVQGEGVIGLFPEIYPGCEDFVYRSCTLSGEGGSMKGSFLFADEEGEELRVRVEEFKFSRAACYKRIECKMTD